MWVILIAAAALAGWVDAVIGGGGLILIPVLMAGTPMPPAAILATNKIAAVSGTASAAVTLVRRVGVPRATWVYAVTAGVLSAAGALVASRVDAALLRPLILCLLIAVGVFVAVKPEFGTGDADKMPQLTRGRTAAAALLAAAVGFYDGTFGPGTGMFLIMGFTALFAQNFLRSAAMSKVVNSATNIGALVVFISAGFVDWPLALALAAANVAGAQVGARTVLGGGAKLVRYALLTLVVVLSTYLAFQL
ncbi:TSUP family transporter [Corynebacterium sp. p3-SID1145]|uniref:TSUP family transporter n=1 Tax=unclassified Corynebacterium TaxID=2624378 RepID=UPI0021AA1C14|nr:MULTISPECIES: TSUP family transporter [unclassified Corynebacterium]MCT1451728.1 TSUP family transporter [Corynebacterium sp. p3-SID1145]MCT1460825.1 TSUP family transporter [Corynebacterium sp. p3-SID1140]